MRIILPILLLTLCCQQLSAQKLENSLLWKVSHPDVEKDSYLFGTYHLVGAEFLNSNRHVLDAYKKTSILVVETVIDSSRLPQLSGMMVMSNHSLEDLVDSAEYQLLKEKVEPVVGVGIEAFHHMKPMVLSNMYALLLARDQTPDSLNYLGQPLEIHLMATARKNEREILQLETMVEQMDLLFNSATVQQQADELMEMLKEEKDAANLTADLIQAYHKEDLNRMWEEAEIMESSAMANDRLLKDRNLKWVEKLETVLQRGDAFIAVGALHLPGETGLISLLKEKGYKLTPVKKEVKQ